MGCCGSSYIDNEIQQANSISELACVMQTKKENLGNEKAEIQAHIANQLKEVTLIDISALSTDDLEKRIPYLDKLSECYGDIIDILSNNQTLPLNETKEHLHSILRNYFVSYDDTETYKIDFDKFKQFALNHNNNNQ